MSDIEDRIEYLLQAEPNHELDYYAISLFLGDKGTTEYSCYSQWVRYTKDSPPREIREASIVHPDRMLNRWRKMDESAMIIEDESDFGLFFSFGGHALVEKSIAEEIIPSWLAPSEVVNVGEFGFASPSCLPETALRRAPGAKLRMQIIKRDNFRCRICGRSPHDYGDLELHVHHIRPWAVGGVTEESNLITLCHTCHNGLDPHFEFSLFKLLKNHTLDSAGLYLQKLMKYQEAVATRSK